MKVNVSITIDTTKMYSAMFDLQRSSGVLSQLLGQERNITTVYSNRH